MVDGNASLTVGTPSFATVGGGLALSFTYNSDSVSGTSSPGLQGYYYNTVDGQSVLVAERVDPSVEFPPSSSWQPAAQTGSPGSITWTGTLTLPTTGGISDGDSVELGETSSDGMTISLGGNNSYLDDASAPHTTPIYGPAMSDAGQSLNISITWTHTSSTEPSVQLYLEDLSTGSVWTVSPSWLSHANGPLPAGWTLNHNAAQASWVGLADHGTSVTMYSSDGSGYEFVNAGNGRYTAPVQDPTAKLSLDASGTFVLDDSESGLIYTFGPSGALQSIRSAGDDLSPAALVYHYDNPSMPQQLTSIQDPVSARSATLTYGPSTSCPSTGVPSGLLCKITFFDSTETDLIYNATGELTQVTNPGSVTYEFGYDSYGRLNIVMDPLSYDAVQAGTRPDCVTTLTPCETTVSYDSGNRASQIISPAPDPGGNVANGGQPQRGYCYGYADAAFSSASSITGVSANQTAVTVTSALPVTVGTTVTIVGVEGITNVNGTWPVAGVGTGTFIIDVSSPPTGTYSPGTGLDRALNCTTATSNTTSLAVAGTAPSVGYAEQTRYDARNRITEVTNANGQATRYLWDASDRLIATVKPDGTEVSSVYDSQGRLTTSYGPAPASSFQANGMPVNGQIVPTATTTYDGGLSGLAAAWYSNTTLSGTPAFHSSVGSSDSWTANQSPSTGTANPGLIPTSGYSGRLTGTLAMPAPGRVSYTGDGGTVSIDGHQVINQAGGPYPAAVRIDAPTDWWRLGDAPGAATALDSAGTNPGSVVGGVTLGGSGPLADGDSTSAAFDGTTGTVTVPDSTQLELTNTTAFSVEAWVKPASTTAVQMIAGKMADAAPYTGWDLYLTSGGAPTFQMINSYPSNALQVTGTTAVTAGSWHHLVVTYDGSSKAAGVTLYIDGTAIGQTTNLDTLSAGTTNAVPFTIGSRDNSAYYFNGSLADTALYSGIALSPTQVSAHYNAAGETSATTTGPIVYNSPYPEAVEADNPSGGYWRMGDPAGSSSATDSWGSANGTYSNVTLGQSGAITGDSTTSAAFNGTTSYVSLPAKLISRPQPLSVETWFKTTSSGPIFGAQNTTPGALAPASYELSMYVGTDGKLRGGLWPAVNLASTVSVNDNRWHQAVITDDGAGNLVLYLDGNQVATGSGAGWTSEPYAQFGAGWGNNAHWPATPSAGAWWYLSGDLQDAAVYHQTLSGFQVLTHYRAAIMTPYPSTVTADGATSLWRLADSPNSTTAVDAFGPYPGSYNPGVTRGEPGPFSADPATSSLFAAASGGYVSVPTGAVHLAGGAFTVEAWFNTTSSGPIFGSQNGPPGGAAPTSYELSLYVGTDGKLRGGMWPQRNLASSGPVNDGRWHHAVITDDGAGNLSLYLDGNQVSTGSGASPAAETNAQIGAGWGNNGFWPAVPAAGAWWYFNGNLADVATYASALTGAQVASHYLSSETNPGVSSGSHAVTIEDQQYISGGGYSIAVSGASFSPDYGLVTSSTDPDGKVTDTSYTDQANIGPEYGLATSQTQDPNGLALKTVTTYEAPGAGRYLRVVAKTLPAGNQTTYVNYCGYGTDPTCASPEQAGAWASACGVTAGSSQWGLVAEKTDPPPATGAGDALVSQYLYDPAGRQVGIRTGTVDTVSTAGWECTTYDAQGRVSSQSWPAFNSEAARTVTYSYAVGGDPLVSSVTDTDWAGSSISSTVDLLDRIVSYSDIWGNTTLTNYDQAGRAVLTGGPQGGIVTNYDPATLLPTTVVSSPYLEAVQTDRPTSLWRLSDPTGSNSAADEFGPNAGQYVGSVTLGRPGPLAGDPATATTFDGSSGTVSIADSPSLEFSNNHAFSVEAWIKTTATGQEIVASKMANASPYTGWEVGVTGGKPYLLLDNTWQTNNIYVTADQAVADGQWHHLVVSYSGSSTAAGVTFFVDGNAVGDSVTYDNLTATTASTAPAYLGSRAGSVLYFNGTIADAAIYPASLSATQVAAHYQARIGTAILSSSAYDPFGRLQSVQNSNGVSETVSYDSNGRLTGRSITEPNSQPITGETETLSPAGRVTDQQVYVNGQGLVDGNPAGPNYTYDGAGRLTQAVTPSSTYNYSYANTSGCPANTAAKNTNRTSLTITGTGAGTTNYCYDNADRLVSTSTIASGQIAYDGHGNTIQEGNETFTYDSSDQLTRTDSPTNITIYSRDPLDRPAQQTTITPISEIATTDANTASGTSINLSVPAGTQPGDLIVASISSNGGNPVVPAGWTLAASENNSGGIAWVAYHNCTSSDPTSWAFGQSTAEPIVGEATTYRNIYATPIDVTAAAADAASTSQALPLVTTTGSGETVLHVVGYDGQTTPVPPSGDTNRYSSNALPTNLEVSDRYQDLPGQSDPATATSSLAVASEAITVALTPATSSQRLGYSGQTDISDITQNNTGGTVGSNIGLPAGVTYSTTPSGTVWSYSNAHGDTITTTDNTGTITWTGYWGPYGENASGGSPPSDTAITGASYGYNGAQGKLTDGNLILMGARPYLPNDGRFTQVDPVVGGCANSYTYSYGDPVNYPDLSGRMLVAPPGGGDSGDPGAAVAGCGSGWFSSVTNFFGYKSDISAVGDVFQGNFSGAWDSLFGGGPHSGTVKGVINVINPIGKHARWSHGVVGDLRFAIGSGAKVVFAPAGVAATFIQYWCS